MNRRLTIIGLTALTLTACSSDTQASLDTCDELLGGEYSTTERAVDLLADVPDDLNESTAASYLEMNDELGGILQSAPNEMAGDIETLRTPFGEIADAVEANEGGAFEPDQGDTGSAVSDLIEECINVGYSLPE